MGPGQYVPDRTEGITRVENLPPPVVTHRSRNYRRRACPRCGRGCYRDNLGHHVLHDLGILTRDRPRDLRIVYSRHRCRHCRSYFSADLSDIAPPGSHYTNSVIALAVRLVVEDGLPYRMASWHLWRDYRVFVPFATVQNWVEAAGDRAATRAEADYLDWALADFSGYLAADELYDGPFCVLSAVDAHHQRRLRCEILDQDPTQADILWFLARLNEHITTRGHTVLGITTDGSPLYPLPIRLALGPIPHQVCQFHLLRELTKAVLGVLARLRKRLAAQAPPPRRGRPRQTPEARRRHRKAQAIRQRVAALFEHRYLFVRHRLTAAQHATLRPLLGYARPLRALRAIMDEVDRLFDRRCRTDTALAKLANLRQRVRRFRGLGKSLDKLRSPNLEKALMFLDDRLLEATSNAVERANRRHRKMQKSIDRVRKQRTLHGRVSLDLLRDRQASERLATLNCLHHTRERG